MPPNSCGPVDTTDLRDRTRGNPPALQPTGSVPVELNDRNRLIDIAFDLCIRRGYAAATIDQISAAAGITSQEFACYFASKDALILSVANDLLQATAALLPLAAPDVRLEEALLTSTMEVLTAIVDGHGIMTRERMISMGYIIIMNQDLQEQASTLRRQVFSQALADHMGVEPNDSLVRGAVTVW